eukprot:GEMP01035322.1.p1 GENE.GEMP01035322.1~~GEMP01035322.1.p1  ORF type:complete len:366 (+),score=93.78 GEMP01035322.1:64-1161(+)
MDMHKNANTASANNSNAPSFDSPDAMLSQLEAMVCEASENASNNSIHSEKSRKSANQSQNSEKSRKSANKSQNSEKRRKSGDESQNSENSRKNGNSRKDSSTRSADKDGGAKLLFGHGGMDFSTFQKKAASGALSLENAFEEMLKIGGREEWQTYFENKMKEDPAAYGKELAKMRPDKCQDKKLKKFKKIYEEDGRIGLEMEFEDEFDQMPRDVRQNMFKLGAPAHAKVLYAKGDADTAMREFKAQYVKDKMAHTMCLVDDAEFDMMHMLTTGEGLKIPKQAILSKKNNDGSGQSANAGVSTTVNAKKQKENDEKDRKKQIAECEAQLRDALQKNDKDKLDRMVNKIKELKGVDSYGYEKKGGSK